MLGILPYDRLRHTDTDRAFRSYPCAPMQSSMASSASSTSSIYSPHHQAPSGLLTTSIPPFTHPHSRLGGPDTMDYRPPTQPFDASSHGLMDIGNSTPSSRMPGAGVKMEHSSHGDMYMPGTSSAAPHMSHGHPYSVAASMASMAASHHTSMGMPPASMSSPSSMGNDLQKDHGQDISPSSTASTSPGSAASAGDHMGGAAPPSSVSNSRMPPKKRPLCVPDEQKDNGYWEKRKKNNESAKRSREARRMKEEQIAMRVVYLEQENLQLRTETSLLKGEIEKLRCMLYNS